MSSGMGVMGESGPEAIMPLARDSSSKLGLAGPTINVYNNNSSASVEVENREDEIALIIGRARKAVQDHFSRSMTSGQGVYARSLESGYKTGRKVR
ncbi:hypothetical protein [Sedimentitalea sp.]|uniref:hypothetical protein n=1 Tax=Sedimentitalea sp. TaxID=2048915 RepID=UPI0032986B24